MKRTLLGRRMAILGAGAIALASLLIGCATSQHASWNKRVGELTYDQALAELGPPAKTNSITDGGLIAQWVTRRPSASSFNMRGTGFFGTYAGNNNYSGGFGTHFLVMKFGPDHKLIETANVTR